MKKILIGIGLACLAFNCCATTPDTSVTYLQNLSNAPGAPGFEGPVRNILSPIFKQYLAQVKQDGLGNLIGTLAGAKTTPNVLLMAHMDEVGFIIKSITENGYVEVEPLGGIKDQVPFAERWIIMTRKGPIIGYSGTESGHIIPHPDQTTKASESSMISLRDMFIDVGAKSQSEAMDKFGLRPGLPITPATDFMALNGSNRYLGKAFDDRAGLALVVEAFKKASTEAHPNQISVAATTQEEIGLRGATVIYNQLKPDIVINLEACIAGDFPLHNAPPASYPALGKGPCLYVYDRTMIPNNNLVEWIISLAKENKIPYQFAIGLNYGEDGSALQQSGAGVPVINIGIPVRYAHQHAGVIDRADYDATLQLLNAIVMKLDSKQIQIING